MNEKFKKVILATVASAVIAVPMTSAASAATMTTSATAVAKSISTPQNVNAQIKLKTVAAMIRAGGWALEVALKPFSKKAANYVLKYRTKIANALDKMEDWSKSKFVSLLTKAGVPKDVAESIADVVVFLVL
ncbi:hypothetical protein [Paenibacillus tarimensis]|uniref:hypothetical protein n=1 Tax=Paenibacillus tarimensis TaxID=416012 RepID=UPI001F2C0CD1|nr:hypothetical protein [Paenibacillus tarimensis]MCF2945745.1 hypothetical protein [Paenibacillus tarimensis]